MFNKSADVVSLPTNAVADKYDLPIGDLVQMCVETEAIGTVEISKTVWRRVRLHFTNSRGTSCTADEDLPRNPSTEDIRKALVAVMREYERVY